MSIKNEVQTLKESFQFYLHHGDVVKMMNDADVALDDRNVSSNQTFEVWIERSNGSKIYLRDMTITDKVLFQFVRVTDSDDPVSFNNIDIS